MNGRGFRKAPSAPAIDRKLNPPAPLLSARRCVLRDVLQNRAPCPLINDDSYGVGLVDDRAAPEPRQGMIISVLTRQDVVVMDPERLMTAARRAFREENPDV